MVRISGPNMILSPPLIISKSDISDMLVAIDDGLTEVSNAR
ncbi:MAG: adenosylmethionine-8-amino-7-oxononanoate aminotransferase [Patiriisocius sp.]|jgi:adenosylmethionine-8-amino-7-oxononanoate aminotransferase